MIRDIVKYNGKEYRVVTTYFRATNIRTTEVRLIENESVTDEVVYHFVTTKSSESQDKHKDIMYNPEKYLSEEAIRRYLIDRRGGPMTNFRKLQSISVEELAKWLDKHLAFDDAPHMIWFAKNYCDKCDRVEGEWDGLFGMHKCEFAYCEKHDKCRFFPEMDKVPDDLEIVKLWLEAEVEE